MNPVVFFLNVLGSLLANIIFLVLGGALFYYFLNRRLKRLRRFFGIGRNNQLTVYLSRLEIDPAGLTDIYGQPAHVKVPAISVGELEEIPTLTQLLARRPPFFSPTTFSGFVDSFFTLSRPELKFLPAPACNSDRKRLMQNPTICIGSTKYNKATSLYLDDAKIDLNLDRDSRQIGYDIGYLVKHTAYSQPHCVVLAMGIGINGTRAAIKHLVNNWSSLYKKYGDRNFRITLVCPSEYMDPEGYATTEEVKEDETEECAWERLNAKLQSEKRRVVG